MKRINKNQLLFNLLNAIKMNFRNRITRFSPLAVLFLALTFVACDKDDDDDPGQPTGPASNLELVGSISDVRTLDPEVTYTISGPVIVEEGGVLNIPAGTRIEAK